MPRKNKRKKTEYAKRLRFNPDKYIVHEDMVVCVRAVKRGEVWYANLGCFDNTSVQRGCRPVLVVSNDASNEKSGMVTVVPLTTKMKKTWYPSHVYINESHIKRGSGNPLQPSQVLVEQIRTVDKGDLQNKVGIVKASKMEEVETALRSWMRL